MYKRQIKNRRSIRRYQEKAVSKAMIQEILQAGILAPSSKNRQPWKFVVVEGESKKDMISAMQYGIERERNNPLLPGSKQHLKGAEYTMRIMAVSYTHLDVYKRQLYIQSHMEKGKRSILGYRWQ